MQTYSQRDPRWAQTKIGKTNLTIGKSGCLMTAIADASSYFGDNLTPPQLNSCQFTADGLLVWGTAIFSKFKFQRRQYGRYDVDIRAALSDPNRVVLLEVANGSHWVLAMGKEFLGNGYKIADPWLGDISDTGRYNENISGAAYFIKK